jgi:aromatic ring-cleaving dioxygenase
MQEMSCQGIFGEIFGAESLRRKIKIERPVKLEILLYIIKIIHAAKDYETAFNDIWFGQLIESLIFHAGT